MENLPQHLKKYIVNQDYSRYSSVDHAVWRFILRQLRAYLGVHAHECYLEGLEKTGISTEKIPSISEISTRLEKFGWRALPVSGFIPPAAFMELQAHGILPIASDMRSLDHLEYTPAPDIVHEAAGHAPILIHPEFSAYLKQYASVAKNAIISREDLNLYEAIRELSDLKENPDSTEAEISAAQEHLDNVSQKMTYVSEAAQLGRMNWWTAEYGLIGNLENPKIFGAGLLSSFGESKHCLSPKVKKIPLSLECIEQGYDITEPQPQLYVTPDFSTLSKVLEDFASTMAFRTGGLSGVKKAIQAQTVNTVVFSSGAQVSGLLVSYQGENPDFLKFEGPCQICFSGKQLQNQGPDHHPSGFSSPLGPWTGIGDRCPSTLNLPELLKLGLIEGTECTLSFQSGFQVRGKLDKIVFCEGRLTLLSWSHCTVQQKDQFFFRPEWGQFDMPVGKEIVSVFGGPADRMAFGETQEFVAKRVPPRKFSALEAFRNDQYQTLRELREKSEPISSAKLSALLELHLEKFPEDWLFYLEIFEVASAQPSLESMKQRALSELKRLIENSPRHRTSIEEGIQLAQLSR